MAYCTSHMAQVGGTLVRVVRGLPPLFHCTLTGPAVVCRCSPGDNLALHTAILGAEAGSVIVCDAGGRDDVGHFGDLMALECQRRGIAGLIIYGAIRDSHQIQEIGFPVFCLGRCPCPPTKKFFSAVLKVEIRGVGIAAGDMIVADSDGVVIVPKDSWRSLAIEATKALGGEQLIRRRMQEGESLLGILGLVLVDLNQPIDGS